MTRATVAQVAAVEEQGVVFFTVGGDELIHDAAVGADELVFGALAEAGEDWAGDGDAHEAEDGGGGGDFDGGGAG